MSRAALPTALLLALAACGGGRDALPPPAGEAAGAAAATETAAAAPVADAEPEPTPLDSAAVARALAEDDALEAENRRTFEARRRSMAGYESCMAQARGVPEAQRERIEAACERLRGNP